MLTTNNSNHLYDKYWHIILKGLRINLKPVILIIIAFYFCIIKIRFYTTNNFHTTRLAGLIMPGHCDTSLAKYIIKDISISRNSSASIPVLYSEADDSQYHENYCVDEGHLDVCIDYFRYNLDESEKEIYSTSQITNRLTDDHNDYIIYNVWLIIFSALSFVLTMIFDYAHISMEGRVSDIDLKNIRRLNQCFGVSVVGFLVATAYGYSTIKLMNCDENYLKYDNDDFCTIIASSAIRIGTVIAPNDVITENIGAFTITFTVLLVWSILFHTSDLRSLQWRQVPRLVRNPRLTAQLNLASQIGNNIHIVQGSELRNITPLEIEYLLTGRHRDGTIADDASIDPYIAEKLSYVKKWKFYDDSRLNRHQSLECSICLIPLHKSSSTSDMKSKQQQQLCPYKCVYEHVDNVESNDGHIEGGVQLSVGSYRQDYESLNVDDIECGAASLELPIKHTVEVDIPTPDHNVHVDADHGDIIDVENVSNQCSYSYTAIQSMPVIPGIIEVPCGHRYHKVCIMTWTIHSQRHATCPVCRSNL